MLVSCNSCKKSDTADVVNDSVLRTTMVNNFISVDRQDMFNQVGETYRWYETCAEFTKFLDEENDGTLNHVTNIFQSVKGDGKAFDVEVYIYKHLVDSTIVTPKAGFWIEDFPLNEAEITVSLDSAFNNIMKVNMPKPHSRQVVLRKEIGPKECNPQWIFGNSEAQLYVDAVTGEVSDTNPAYSKE